MSWKFNPLTPNKNGQHLISSLDITWLNPLTWYIFKRKQTKIRKRKMRFEAREAMFWFCLTKTLFTSRLLHRPARHMFVLLNYSF